jgi:hypothetical protein
MDSESWIENALNVTNGLREFHSAPPLEWSEECFEAAKRQANLCQEKGKLFADNLQGPSGQHGQNLLYSETPITEWVQIEDVIDEWYTLSDNYCFIDPGPSEGLEYLTQLLWANTKEYGLAVSEDGHYIVANFFPPGNVANEYADNIRLPEYVVDEDVGKLGMMFGSLPPDRLIVRSVQPDTWAFAEGVKESDEFVAVNGKDVKDISKQEFTSLIKMRPLRLRLRIGKAPPLAEGKRPAKEVEAVAQLERVERSGRRGSIARGVIDLVADESVEKIGMVMTLPPKPVEVRKVTPGGWADQKGIEPGDTFTAVNGRPVYQMTHDEFKGLLSSHDRPLTFRVPTIEELAAAVKIQKITHGMLDRKEVAEIKRLKENGIVTVQDWKLARSRAARKEKREDDARDDSDGLQMPRDDVIARVFISLDRNNTQTLCDQDLFFFVQSLDFPGDEAAWKEEYAHLRNDMNILEGENFSYEDFVDMVDDDDANPYYCGYERLWRIEQDYERRDAATKLQSVQRGRQARRRAAGMKEDEAHRELHKKRTAAAIAIQTAQRGKAARKQAAEMAEEQKLRSLQAQSAIKIQAVQRGNQGRKEAVAKAEETEQQKIQEGVAAKAEKEKNGYTSVAKKKEVKAEARREQAAVTIQAAQRGKVGRELAANAAARFGNAPEQGHRDEAAAKFAEEVKAKVAEKSGTFFGPSEAEVRKEVAATHIQAFARGNHDRKVAEEMKSNRKGFAVSNMGATNLAADVSVAQKQAEAATTLQSVQRGRGARKDVEARRRVFVQFDADQDGWLNEQEMLAFARHLGYDGNAEEWSHEFMGLCADHGWGVQMGVDIGAFVWLTTNPDDQYWFDATKLTGRTSRSDGWAEASGNLPKSEGSKDVKPMEVQKELDVPIQAQVRGLDWALLESHPALKESIIGRICAQLAQKAGVNVSDLHVTLTACPLPLLD